MSDDVKINLTRLGVVLGVLALLATPFGTFILLSHRVDAAEKAIIAVQTKVEADHDLLQRIDERTMRIEKAIDRITK
jgi:hypothetical protein